MSEAKRLIKEINLTMTTILQAERMQGKLSVPDICFILYFNDAFPSNWFIGDCR